MKNSSFKVGKYYRHRGGAFMHIIGAAETTGYGWALVAEELDGRLRPVGQDVGCTVNWTETTEADWERHFS